MSTRTILRVRSAVLENRKAVYGFGCTGYPGRVSLRSPGLDSGPCVDAGRVSKCEVSVGFATMLRLPVGACAVGRRTRASAARRTVVGRPVGAARPVSSLANWEWEKERVNGGFVEGGGRRCR